MDMIKLIKTPEDHAEALARVADLMDSENSEDSHELNALSLLIADYEKRNQLFSIDKPITALDIIKLRMEQNGLSHEDMQAYLGSKSKVSEVLNGKRGLSLAMIRKLSHGLNIAPELLII